MLDPLVRGAPAGPEEAALLAAVAAEPDDDTSRLVLADLYEEAGAADRADAIRRGVKRPKRFTFAEGAEAVVAYTSERPESRGRVTRVTLARARPGVRWTSYKGLIARAAMPWDVWTEIQSPLTLRDYRLDHWVPEIELTTPPLLAIQGWGPNDPDAWAFLPGSANRWRVEPGDDPGRVVLRAEWPSVARWVLPDTVALIV